MLEKLKTLKWWSTRGQKGPQIDHSEIFKAKYERFKELLESNTALLKIITDIEEKLQGREIFGMSYVRSQSARAAFCALRMVESLNALSGQRYAALFDVVEAINSKIKEDIGSRKESPVVELILPYSQISKDMVDWVGGKNANLGEVFTRVKLPIPEGFAITTRAFEFFISANNLIDDINKQKIEINPNEPETLNIASEEIQRLIISAPVPPELKNAILTAYDEMVEMIRQKGSSDSSHQVSLRSSAIGEDSDLSYAGQYLSVLNVSRNKLIQTYIYIIASLYTPRAMSYRLSKGIRDEDIAMSVACLQMVESVASGVAYSRHPFNLLDDSVIITAVYGLGPYAVDGVITPDTYVVARDGLSILEVRNSHKPVQLVSNPEGGLMEIPVPESRRAIPCLNADQIKQLAGYALRLEKHYGFPQDVEWALSPRGDLLVLQTRPLHIAAGTKEENAARVPEVSQYPILIEKGAVAFPGVGFGKAFQVNSDEDLENFPEGAVLVAKHSSPKFVVVMRSAKAIITDSGSVTGHMASLTREFEVPAILDTKVATSSIPTGMEVTVDAHSGRVYQGKVPELLSLQTSRESHMKDTPVYQTLKKVAESIVPLRLVDPRSKTFTPEYCKSLHDVMRFVHELSYDVMFQISDMVSEGEGCAVKLAAPIPLDLYIIDLGNGLAGTATKSGKVTVDKIVSAPFAALLKGMLHEDLRFQRPRPIELKGFFSVMSEQMLSGTHTAERFGDRSYAIISDKYLNFSSRVGYHYSILDSYCGQTTNKNYITFSFKGGAADDIRKNRRARAIALMLKGIDFSVEVTGDRVDAKFQKYERMIIEDKLDALGRLLQFTRQMDMLMDTEASVETMAKCFLEGNYHLE